MNSFAEFVRTLEQRVLLHVVAREVGEAFFGNAIDGGGVLR